MTKLIPIEDHVLVEPIEEKNETPHGILMPDNNKEKPSRGTVIAVGQGKVLENGQRSQMDVKAGDIVHFTKYAPDELEIDENGTKKKYLIIKHSSVLAVEVA